MYDDSFHPDVELKVITDALAPPPERSFYLAINQGKIEFINYSQEPQTVSVNWEAAGLVGAFGDFARASVDFSATAYVCPAQPLSIFPDCDNTPIFEDELLDFISVENDKEIVFLSPNERRGTIPSLPIPPAIYDEFSIYPSITILYVRAFSESEAIATSVPEPTSALGFLALGTLGIASALKRKQNQKSTEKETTKVG